jgi:glycosyltransferase involved in cell wall biosynthesis
MKSLVSIIIPTYNRADLIGETLDSIVSQSYQHWECILVDDGSEDRTMEVVAAFAKADSRISYHKRPAYLPKGANACRNYGLELSRGIYINFFDSDDLMHDDKLKLQVASLDHGLEDFNVCQTLVFEGVFVGKGVLRSQLLRTEDPFNDFISHKIKWLTQAPMLRRAVLEKYQICFNEELQQSQELDLFVRLLARTTAYSVIEQPLVFLRMHSDSISYGSFTLEKLTSSFRVRHQFLIDFEERINETSRKVVLKELIALYGDYLKNKEKFTNSSFCNFYKMIKNQLATKKQRLLLFLMKYSYKILHKGEWIKARLQAIL